MKVDSKQLFKKYHSRLVIEGIIKALILGLIVGFAVDFIVAFVTWFIADFNGLWLSVGLGLGVFAVSSIIFYFTMFRPTTKQIAERVDRLGLEERMITMLELQKDESYIAMLQREDASAKIKTVDSKRIKFRVSKAAIVVMSVVFALGVSMTTVTGLSAEGKVIGGDDFIDSFIPDEFMEVSYVVEEGGYIEGEPDQLVLKGENASTVIAVADEGWMFVSWSDENADPVRTDIRVLENMTITAYFVQVEEEESDSGEGDGDGDDADDQPEQGNQDQSGDQSDPADSSGGTYEQGDQVIDGETYYRDVIEEYYEQAMQMLAEGQDIPPELREIIEAYYGIIN